jgi:hypothetical protein
MAKKLRIKPTAQDWLVAAKVYARFRIKRGSRHIATLFALAHLAALLREHPVKSVLEFGSGIGTITYLLLARLPRGVRIVCAERDAWCRERFEENVPATERDRVELIAEGRPEISEPFDLVVIDGPVTGGVHYVREGSLWFHEGNRGNSRAAMEADMASRGFACPLTRYHPYKVRWRRGRYGIPIPRLASSKGCYVGRVQRLEVAGDAAGRVAPAHSGAMPAAWVSPR